MTRIDLAWPAAETSIDERRLIELYEIADRSQPIVRVNFVSSLDGSATHEGLSGGLGSDADRRVFAVLRRLCDVVLVGAGTVREEGYGGMSVDDEAVRWREARGIRSQPVLAIVSGSLDLEPGDEVFARAVQRPIVFTTDRAGARKVSAIEAVADVVVAGRETVDPAAVVAELVARGLPQVLCEGGPGVFGSFIAADAVDELCLTLSPTLEAGDGPRISHGATPEARGMSLAHVLVGDGSLLLRYRRP